MSWALSIIATIIALYSVWLYGNKSIYAPIFGIVACLLWAIWDISFDAIPLLIPTFFNAIIQTRNYFRYGK